MIWATHYPSNPDSIAYRFPRVYWYFAHGAFSHFSNVVDPRTVYYPTNGVAAYLPLLHYHFGPMLFTVPSILCWAMVGLTTFLFARDLGGSRIASAATAWIIVLTPNILIQAISTNDEIIAASAMLAGLYFMHRWFKARQQFDFLIGFGGICLSGGTKLHLVFYWPMFVIVGISLAVHHRALRQEISRWLNLRGLVVAGASIFLFVALFCSFMIYSYISTGQTMDPLYASQILNTPFNPKVALQTVLVYASQVVLGPVPDLFPILDGGSRTPSYTAYNQLLAPLFTWVNNGVEYTSVSYRFTGITSAAAIFRNEQTVLFGLTWLVALMAGLRLIGPSGRTATWSRFHLLGLLVWFLTWASSTKYIEGIAVYIAFAIIVSGPTLVHAWGAIENRKLSALRWGLLGLVAVTHCAFAVNILVTNSSRALYFVRHAQSFPISRSFLVDTDIDYTLSLAKNGITDHTISWEQPHWLFMMKNPWSPHRLTSFPAALKAPEGGDFKSFMLKYSREVVMPAPGDLSMHIYEFPQYPNYGFIPLRITGKATPGLTYVGNFLFGLGPEWLFAAGSGVEQHRAGRSGYIVLSFSEVSNFGRDEKPVLEVSPYLYGLGQEDRLAFRYSMKIDGEVVDHTDWDISPAVHLNTTGLSNINGLLLIEVRNDNANGTVNSIDVPLRSFQPLTLN